MLPVFRKSASVPSIWDEFFGNALSDDFWKIDNYHCTPSVNIAETDKQYRLEVAAPGMSKDDFKISLEENVLTISSEKEEKNEQKEDKWVRREFKYNSFKRTFILPELAEKEQISATYNDGVLHLNVPKKEQAEKQTRNIKVA